MKPTLLLFAITFTTAAMIARAGDGDPKPQVTSVTVRDPAIDDVDQLLHITRRSGRVVLGADAPTGRLEIEFYEGGKKLPITIRGGGYDVRRSPADKRTVDFSLQAADLDWLKLGDGPKGHCRVMLKLATASVGATATNDVPKDLFDFRQVTGGSSFDAKAATATDVPLFWLVTDTNWVVGGPTVEKVIELNPKGKLAIAFLRLGERR
jgi:hypothetical protein